MYDDYDQQEQRPVRRSFMGGVANFLLSVLKIGLAVAAVVTGAVLFSDRARDLVDKYTGGEGQGWGSAIRDKGNDIKEKTKEVWNGIFNPTPPPEPPGPTAEAAGRERAEAMATSAGSVAGLVALRSTPAGLKAGAEALEHTGQLTGNFISKATGTKAAGTIGAGLKATGNAVVTPAKDTFGLLNVFKTIEGTKAVSATAQATTAVTESSLPLVPLVAATKEATTFGKIFGRFATKAAPAAKLGSKVVMPIAAVVGVGFDGAHAKNLVKEGKTGSAVAQGVGTTAETVGLFTGPLGFAVGSVAKEVIRTGDQLMDPQGQADVTRSAIGEGLDMIPGVKQTQNGIALGMGWAGNRVADVFTDNPTVSAKGIQRNVDKRTQERIEKLSPELREQFNDILVHQQKDGSYKNDYGVLMATLTGEHANIIAQQDTAYAAGDAPAHGLSGAVNKPVDSTKGKKNDQPAKNG